MSLKDSLRELQEGEKLSVKREVKKELTKIKKETKKDKRCIICDRTARFALKGTSNFYCKQCALENFSSLDYLQKL